MSEMKFKNGRQEEFPRSNFSKLLDSRKLLRSVRNSIREEQRNLILGRKSRQEEDEYFNFVKFLLSSPDRASLR